MSDAWQKCGNLHYAIIYNVIWANHKTEHFEYHWLRALAMFHVTSFPAILWDIERQFKFCWYVNYCQITRRGGYLRSACRRGSWPPGAAGLPGSWTHSGTRLEGNANTRYHGYTLTHGGHDTLYVFSMHHCKKNSFEHNINCGLLICVVFTLFLFYHGHKWYLTEMSIILYVFFFPVLKKTYINSNMKLTKCYHML